MNRIVLAFSITFLAQLLPAQDVTYVIFNRDCMSQLVYRYAYPNVKGDEPVFAYSVRPNVLENYVFISEGSGHYSPTMPDGAVSCRSLDLSDGFISAINRDDRQMLIVFQRQEGGYWLMPIGSATMIARSGPKYWIRSKNCSFTFDTLRMENDINLAVAGSPTAVYFKGAQLRNCLMEYSFHCESAKSGQLRSDIELIPSLGFSSDRSGLSSAKALENEMQLSRVNGQNVDDFIALGCPEEAKIAIAKTQRPAEYGFEKETYGYSETDKETASIKANKPVQYNYDGANIDVHCAEKLGEGYHIVQKGDNLRGIARTYGVDVASLIKWNNIKDPNKIEICQTIWYQKPVANPEKSAKGVAASKPVASTTTGTKVIDQRKLAKTAPPTTTTDKGVRPKEYTTQDENYDSWRQKPVVKATTPLKPQQYEYTDEPAVSTERPLIHKVKKGEYLYKLAKMYDCPDECIRQANGMQEEGDVDLAVGQKIIIPEGNCQQAKKNMSTKNVPYEEPVNTTAQKKNKMKESTLLDPVTYGYDDQAPQKEGKTAPDRKKYVDEWPIEEETDKAKAKTSTAKKATTETAKVPQFKEHLARQGDTLRSIAAKYKVDPAELAQVNGLGLNEAVTPGKWILVPIQEE